MSPRPDLQPADVVWVDHPAGMEHPAVVIGVRADLGQLLLALGTGTHRPQFDPVSVVRGSRHARAMGLTKNTYFYAVGCVVLPLSAVNRRPGRRCPLDLFVRLQAMFAAAHRDR